MSHLTVIQPVPARPLSEIRACAMPLYDTRDSLVEAVQFIESELDLEPGKVFPLLMLYHNTLIKVLAEEGADGRTHR